MQFFLTLSLFNLKLAYICLSARGDPRVTTEKLSGGPFPVFQVIGKILFVACGAFFNF